MIELADLPVEAKSKALKHRRSGRLWGIAWLASTFGFTALMNSAYSDGFEWPLWVTFSAWTIVFLANATKHGKAIHDIRKANTPTPQ